MCSFQCRLPSGTEHMLSGSILRHRGGQRTQPAQAAALTPDTKPHAIHSTAIPSSAVLQTKLGYDQVPKFGVLI